MNAAHKDILNRNRLLLVRELHITETFLTCLTVDYTLTAEMKEDIMAQSSSTARNGKLLDILVKRGPNAFDRFIFALVETDQEALAEELDKHGALQYKDVRDAKRKVMMPVFNSQPPPNIPGQGMMPQWPMQMPQWPMQMPYTAEQLLRFNQQLSMMQNAPFMSPLQQQHYPQPTETFVASQPMDSKDPVKKSLKESPMDNTFDSPGKTVSGNPVGHPAEEEPSNTERKKPKLEPGLGAANTVDSTDASVLKIINDLDAQPLIAIPVQPCLGFEQLNSDDVYQVRRSTRGRAVIISNRYFVQKKMLERLGSEYDEKNLERLFKELQFDTVVHKNRSKPQIQDILENERRSPLQKNADMFVLFILTHGARGTVFGTDGGELTIDSITNTFDGNQCPDLNGKPKLFFIQACQGDARTGRDQADSDGMTEPNTELVGSKETFRKMLLIAAGDISDADKIEGREEQPGERDLEEKLERLYLGERPNEALTSLSFVHEKADTLVAYATVQGYQAWRRSDMGSWFVRCIVYVFAKYAYKEHLTDMLTKVNYILSQFETKGTKKLYRQIAEKKDTLRKKVYFFPGYRG